jgi:aquaporin TIP
MAKLVNKLVDSFDHHEAPAPDVGCVRAVLAELVLTFLFVFTGVSASMAAGTYPHPMHPPELSPLRLFLSGLLCPCIFI